MTHRLCLFQVLDTLAASELRFSEMQQEFYALKREHDEALKKVTKYQEDLNEANERVKRREVSIFSQRMKGITYTPCSIGHATT